MEKNYLSKLKESTRKKPVKPDLPSIPQPSPQDLADIIALFKDTAAQSLDAEKTDRFAKFAESLTLVLPLIQALYPVLKAIAERPDPEAPVFPEFPSQMEVTVTNPTEEVSVVRPDWYEPLTKADIQEAIQPVVDALTAAESNDSAIDRVTLVDAEGRPIDLSKLFVQKATATSNIPMFRGGINLKTEVVLDGTVNDSNTDFTIPAAYPTPKAESVRLFLNGARLQLNVDYTQSGRTFTMTTPPPSGGQAPVIDYEAQ